MGLSNTLFCALTNYEVDLEGKVWKTTSSERQVIQKASSTVAEGASSLAGVERATVISCTDACVATKPGVLLHLEPGTVHTVQFISVFGSPDQGCRAAPSPRSKRWLTIGMNVDWQGRVEEDVLFIACTLHDRDGGSRR